MATTYRERRLARAERLREWAAKNERKATERREGVDAIAGMIPMGQPILVGHHSERRHRADIARIDNGMRATIELGGKAARQASAADEIEAQADRAIYSDDADAVERLTEKIAALEATRDRRKAANAAYRKEHRAELKAMTAYERGQAVPFPSYSITNMTGNIGRLRDRLKGLEREREHGPRDRTITARFASECATCGAALEKGSTIRYNRQQGARCAESCGEEG